MTAPDSSAALQPLLDPRSIVVVGASASFTRLGGVPIKSMLDSGFPIDRLLLVNPKYPEIAGLRCYPRIEDLPFVPDLAVLAVPASAVAAALRACRAKGIRAATIFASGFAEERSDAAQRLQAELAEIVRAGDIAVCGPNCVGHINFHSGAFATFIRRPTAPSRPGPIAVVAQSGNLAATLWYRGREVNLGFSHLINTGNEVGLDIAGAIDYLCEDSKTEAVVSYIEQIRDGQRFLETAVRMRQRGKQLFIVKSGTSEKGAEATASHTASMAGSSVAYAAAFAQVGALTANEPTRLMDLVRLWKSGARPAGLRVCVASLSGAGCALLADHCARYGLQVPTLRAQTQDRLRTVVPSYGAVANPIDFTGQVINDDKGFFPTMLDAVLTDPEIDAVLFYVGTYVLDAMAPELVQRAAASGKAIVVIDTGLGAQSHAALEEAGVPVFTDIDRAVAATATLLRWSRQRSGIGAWQPFVPDPVRAPAAIDPVIAAAHREGRAVLTEVQAKDLLARAGLPMVREAVAHSAEQAAAIAADLGHPVAVKVVSPQIAHKSDVGGVALDLADAAAVRAAFARVTQAARAARPDATVEGAVVQPMVGAGQSVLLGIVRDPVFGPVMTVGLGGVLTELIQDVAHRVLPVDAPMAESMLRELRTFPLLDGFRGSPKADLPALVQLMVDLSRYMLEQGDDIDELELNPVLVRPRATRGALAVDALIRLRGSSEERNPPA
ncbi:acetate--CoA ligase family protein [Pseudorhodoferax sp.]|uniref:acetate--CoA ligase family protein n=1 Tax=Pseudorhodoferax sp. TaxID=1993553 RepID=UPI002DD69F4F|nr:acetate--CoA ligase family protein [Pseudorhodoferax sp.]